MGTRKYILLARILFLAGSLAFLAVLPTQLLENGPSICLFRNLFGISCLGCGMTRALSSVMHANIASAISYNQFVIVVFPLVFLTLLRDLIVLGRRPEVGESAAAGGPNQPL